MKNASGVPIFYYNVIVKTKNDHIKKRQGVIAANYVSDAMNELDRMAEGWKCTIQKCKIHEVDEHGELVLQTIDKDFFPNKKEAPKTDKPAAVHQPAMYPLQYASIMPQVQNFPILKLEDTK